ncbi:MAG: PaaX family transcriptional regulator C-terminal domain-containing protein, partial [Nocardioidaceae bacterium]
ETRSGRRGYALTRTALDALAAGDEVIWHARRPAVLSDGWCVVTFSLPESARTRRHQLRSHLTSLGFGNAGAGVWLAPARMRIAAERAIGELGLTPYCAVFVGDYVAGQDLVDLLRSAWDLADIDERYRGFAEEYQPLADRLLGEGLTDSRDAFVTYLGVVDRWRKLPFRDPGLPPELLAENWSAPDATALFEHLVGSLEGRALAHAASYWNGER